VLRCAAIWYSSLEDILRRRDAGTVAPFERVVIETSGLAGSGAHPARPDERCRPVCERPAPPAWWQPSTPSTASARSARHPESVKQVAVADRLI
jgi:hypothetical protein